MILQLYINTRLRDELPVTLENYRTQAVDLRERFRHDIEAAIQWRIELRIRSTMNDAINPKHLNNEQPNIKLHTDRKQQSHR